MVKSILRKITPRPVIKLYHFLWAFLSACFYGFPSRKLKVIGITGTNGKSTTVKIIAKICKEAGLNIASLSSIDFEIVGEKQKNLFKMTMPGHGFLQKFLQKAARKNCDVAVLEITSEGIEQFRHLFIDFDIAIITNLAPEHIESHGSFEAYKKAKGKLFKAAKKTHILNVDDDYVSYFESFSCKKRYGYGKEDRMGYDMIFQLGNIEQKDAGLLFSCQGINFEINLLGEFNVYNALAGICVAEELDIDFKIVQKALSNIKVIPGRMEKIIEKPFLVIIDYAFTPNALGKVYSDIRSKFSPKKMIVVLGACGGGRDKWKRPILGKIAAQAAEKVIVTNEDPYDEDPLKIINEVASGVGNKAEKILDRREAISKALQIADAGDAVVITGKGSEAWIQIGKGKKISWSDKKVVQEEFDKLYLQN